VNQAAIQADIDRIALARKREDVLKPLAEDNLKTPTGGRGLTPAKLPESKPPIDRRKESAKTAGVGERTYDAGKLILDGAESGHIVSSLGDTPKCSASFP
jgi:hypothetical protein